MFTPSIYRDRRNALAQQMTDNGLLLIFGNEESPMNYTDNTYPFRQDSNFLYFAGLEDTGHFLIMDLSTGKTTLYGNDLSLDHIVWMGNQPSMDEKTALIGADQHAPYKTGLDVIRKAKEQQQPVHYLPPYRAERVELLADCLGQSLQATREGFSAPLCHAVIKLRSLKTAEEAAEMDKAVDITRAMHLAAMRTVAEGQRESTVAGIVEGIAIGGGGRLAYPCIGTINGHILHNHHHGNVVKDGHLYLLDAGASSISQYAGDITRTFPVAKTFTSQQKDIYAIVLKALDDCSAALRPGFAYKDAHLQAARIIVEGLKDLGLMKGDTESAVAEGAHALFFPHGLGHMIGLDVHDMEDLNENWVGYDENTQRSTQFGLKSLRLAKKLEAGFALTVEPGIYFIPTLIERWEAEGKFKDFVNYGALKPYFNFGGIRIEDNLLITENGSRLLGKAIPKSIADIEAARQL
jgi:Xaa-Pro aminopeptidase